MESLVVLITYPLFPYLEQELLRRGCHLLRLYHSPQTNHLAFLRANASSIRAVVCDTHVGADAAMIEALPALEIVSTFSVGVDKVDLVKCKERGVRVTNTPDVLTDDVADLAIGLAIAVLRKLPAADRFVRSGASKKKGGYPLATKFSGKRVGILGLGRIGLAIAQRAEAFNCPVSYHSRSKKPHPNYKYYSSPLDLASNCDVLVVSCSLTDETRLIINREVIDALGPQGVLLNIGRGPHVDESELVSALVDGRLGGAGLDVFENEPDIPEELFQLDNVVMTPHVGSDTVETSMAMADLVIANLEAHAMGRPLLTPVV
ncbi:hypothetical protein LUZ63_016490 [Rhynchospora breviuscula]|uniref:Hydroxyphenylpyruvate reductase n=1 Tax=Rhynchospora breviuscula TaxID=2022672 RepID=A0A9Q0C0G4_9POAL|nr:hypothetical protein LUZ63_016490 [Rhynchospora breviuscula]